MTVLSSRGARLHAGVVLRGLAIGGIAVVVAVGTAAELAALPTRSSADLSAAVYALDVVAVGALFWMRRAPIFAATVALAAAVASHFLGFPGGAGGMALFYATFELARTGRRAPTTLAFALPVLWAGALMLPPAGVRIDSPGLLGPVAGMLWMAGTGVAVRRTRAKPDDDRSRLVPGSVAGVRRLVVASEVGELSALTPREREVVALVGTGLDNSAIAELLFVSPTTVKSHVNHAMGKLGTTTRAQLVARAHRYGLVSQ